MLPAHETVLKDIIEIIEKASLEELSQFENARLQKLIQDMYNVNTSVYYDLMGQYYNINNDFERAKAFHLKAIEESPYSYRHILNYAVTLFHSSYEEEAFEYCKKAIEIADKPDEIFEYIISFAYQANREDILSEFLIKYKKVTGTSHPVETWLKEDEEDFAEIPSIFEETLKEGCINLDGTKKGLEL